MVEQPEDEQGTVLHEAVEDLLLFRSHLGVSVVVPPVCLIGKILQYHGLGDSVGLEGVPQVSVLLSLILHEVR